MLKKLIAKRRKTLPEILESFEHTIEELKELNETKHEQATANHLRILQLSRENDMLLNDAARASVVAERLQTLISA